MGFRMAAHPLVLGVADALLAPYCERIQLHIGMFRRLCPGETASPGVKSLGVPVKDWDWDTLWLLNSSPWKIAHRWFTVLNSRVIFHGDLLVITRW